MPVMIRPHFRRLVRKTRPLSPQTQAPPWQWKDPLASPPWWTPVGATCNKWQLFFCWRNESTNQPWGARSLLFVVWRLLFFFLNFELYRCSMSNDIQVITLLKWGMFQVYAFCFALGPLFNTNIYIYIYLRDLSAIQKKTNSKYQWWSASKPSFENSLWSRTTKGIHSEPVDGRRPYKGCPVKSTAVDLPFLR